MRFQEPERFVQVARCSGKDVRGIRIAGLGSLIDVPAQRICYCAIAFDQRRQMILDGIDIGGIGHQRASLSYCLRGTERGAAKLDHAFSHRVYMGVNLPSETIQHLVDGDELRPLEIPMRLVGQQRQIDAFRNH